MYLSTTITASPSVISERMQTFLEVLITPSTIPRQYPASKPCVDFLQYPASSFPSNLSGVSSFTTPKAANENNITKAIKDMFFIVVSFVDFHCVCCQLNSVNSSQTALHNVQRSYLHDDASAMPT